MDKWPQVLKQKQTWLQFKFQGQCDTVPHWVSWKLPSTNPRWASWKHVFLEWVCNSSTGKVIISSNCISLCRCQQVYMMEFFRQSTTRNMGVVSTNTGVVSINMGVGSRNMRVVHKYGGVVSTNNRGSFHKYGNCLNKYGDCFNKYEGCFHKYGVVSTNYCKVAGVWTRIQKEWIPPMFHPGCNRCPLLQERFCASPAKQTFKREAAIEIHTNDIPGEEQ